MKRPRLVLVRPRNADNLVSIARAMRAFELDEWVAVSSAKHLDGMLDVLAHHREDAPTVEGLRRVDTLAEAVAGCDWVVGTTMRSLAGQPRLTARELAATALRCTAPWALVFGAESNGLQNDDLAHCHAVSFIPAAEAQPSLNLSQAVVIFTHELKAARDEAALASTLQKTFGADELTRSVTRGHPSDAETAAWEAVCARLSEG